EFADKGKIALQIEINQDLYVERISKQLGPERLEDVKRKVSRAFEAGVRSFMKDLTPAFITF
ncbi:MAG TPA: hypothetical protein VMW90_01395, partial [Acidobacteriota bacterium]|nr:hypothetical protein [Acidobacteriota bacterium]